MVDGVWDKEGLGNKAKRERTTGGDESILMRYGAWGSKRARRRAK